MSDVFFQQLGMTKPKYQLQCGNMNNIDMITSMMTGIRDAIEDCKPDIVHVNGDTNNTLAGALTAERLGIPIMHSESGYRRGTREIPEEMNRVLTDHMSTYLFAYSNTAMNNLKKENIVNKDGTHCYFVGDALCDSYSYLSHKVDPSETIKHLVTKHDDFVYMTLHRNVNVDSENRLRSILHNVSEMAKKHEFQIILPLHPRTRKQIIHFNIKINNDRIIIIDPVGLFDSYYLTKNCKFTITDSGGLTRESHFAKKYCIHLLGMPEFPELLNLGAMYDVSDSIDLISEAIESILSKKSYDIKQQYGNGNAAINMITNLVECLRI